MENDYKDERPQFYVTLPKYYIGRYPVTVAQFGAFVEDAEYKPRDWDCLAGLPNHPVVYVGLRDAGAYCEWLTEQLHTGQKVPAAVANRAQKEGWVVTLPSEAEWEQAARGPDGAGGFWPTHRVYPARRPGAA